MQNRYSQVHQVCVASCLDYLADRCPVKETTNNIPYTKKYPDRKQQCIYPDNKSQITISAAA